LSLNEKKPFAVKSRWREMVGYYSDLQLSFEIDRLPALSGRQAIR
jgi:hypothetical protein